MGHVLLHFLFLCYTVSTSIMETLKYTIAFHESRLGENLLAFLSILLPTKMSLFFFGNNFYKNKETFKIFSPQILEVYRILLVETTLESIMFYYTFSVINTMFVPCTPLLYESTAASRRYSSVLFKK